MSSTPLMDATLRDRIIADPDVLLDDKDIMRALVAANERAMGHNVVDLRGIAMERLEARLDRLEDAHRSVIAAAYENLAGTNQVHRAVLRLLDADRFETFLRDLSGEVAQILGVEAMRLVLESAAAEADPAVRRMEAVLCFAQPGFVATYITRGRGGAVRGVTLRQTRVRVASGSQNGQVDQVRFAVFARVGAPNAAAAVRCGAQRRALLATPLLQPLLSLRALCRCCSAAAACCGL